MPMQLGGLPDDPNEVPPSARPVYYEMRDRLSQMIVAWEGGGANLLPSPHQQAEELIRVHRAYTAPVDPRIRAGAIVRQKPGLVRLHLHPGVEGALVLVVWRLLDAQNLEDGSLIAHVLTEHQAEVDCMVAAYQPNGQPQTYLHNTRCLDYDERLNG